MRHETVYMLQYSSAIHQQNGKQFCILFPTTNEICFMPDMGTMQSREPRQSGAARFSSIGSYDFNTKRIQSLTDTLGFCPQDETLNM